MSRSFPYVKQPEDLVLGKPMYFATAHPFPTGAIPVLIKSDAFRPIKVDGNPEHPMSKGRSDAFTQATLLDLYDPDRSQHVLHRGQNLELGRVPGGVCQAAVKKTSGGQGLYFLSETITSPTLAAQWKQVQATYPQAKLVQWEPVNRDSSRAASKAAFGSYYRRAVQAGGCRCHPLARCGLPWRHRASGLPADGGGLCGAASLRRRQDDEPAVRRRDDADGDRIQGGASAGAEAERDCCALRRRW